MNIEDNIRRIVRDEVRAALTELERPPGRALTTAEVGDVLGVVPRVVVDMIHRTELRGWRLHGDRGDWRVSARDLENFMEDRAEAA